jgi:ankyrin repeat protein
MSGLPPVPVGGPGVYPIHAASGVGYGQEFAANAHRHVPNGWLPAVKYLVEELGADVNQRDFNGYTPLHDAAARGDNDLIQYLVGHGADVTVVSRAGQTTADMANGPQQRVQPFPETVALLEKLGAKNNHNCVSCD